MTYVSILNWTGSWQPTIVDVRRALGRRMRWLRGRGLHSLAFLPDEGACTAVMVSSCDDEAANAALAADILPEADVLVECMALDEPQDQEALAMETLAREELPLLPRDFRTTLLLAMALDEN